MKQQARYRLGVLAVAGLAATTILSSSSALAADDTDVLVIPGGLSVTNPSVGNFANVTLDGTAKTTTTTFDNFEVSDARGSGAGWHVTVQATRFTEIDPTLNVPVVNGKTLPLHSLSMAAPSVEAVGTNSPVPSITSGPFSIDAASGVKIASAATDAGMGKYNFTQGATPLTLSIPSSAYAKRYRSTVTVSTVTGP